MTSKTNPRSYASAGEFLLDVLKERQRRNQRFSLRAWARQLGYKNPSLLSDVMAGRRKMSEELMGRVAANVGLSTDEERHVWRLAQAGAPAGKRPRNLLGVDRFRVIADWQHLVILELFLLSGFRAEAKAIAGRLFKRISVAAVDLALERLTRVGMLEVGPDGALRRSAAATDLFVGCGNADAAIRGHHEQFLEMALEALARQSIGERDFSGSTVAVCKSDLPKVKAAVYQLHSLFNALAAKAGAGDAVYRLNVQLFRVDREE